MFTSFHRKCDRRKQKYACKMRSIIPKPVNYKNRNFLTKRAVEHGIIYLTCNLKQSNSTNKINQQRKFSALRGKSCFFGH